jgi:hypothetical protein
MTRSALIARKYAILFHRWLGVAFCLLFAVWFLSGIVMMYWSFPGVSPRDRIEHAPALDASRVILSPAEAFAKLEAAEAPARVRLVTLDGRPIYRFQFGRFQFGSSLLSVFADTGESLDAVPSDMARRIAAAWTGLAPSGASIREITQPDQWTVGLGLSRTGPLWKFGWPSGEEVYISQATGEVLQATTRGSRLGAWFGAIPHWLYFTPLRKDGRTWSSVVIWSSGIGTFVSLLGLVVGFWLYSPSARRYKFPSGASGVPYAGQKRWHAVFGLVFGVFAVTWAFSGMLSMDPSFWPESRPLDGPARSLREAWSPDAFQAVHPRDVLRLGSFKELELAQAMGEAVYLAKESPDQSRIIAVSGAAGRARAAEERARPSREEFEADRIVRAIALAAAPYQIVETRRVTEYEAYYIDRRGRKPLPALFVRLNDPDQSSYYIDLKTAQVVQSYDSTSRWNRWLYHGLHSMDLPWLYRNRPAWDAAVLLLMGGGTILSVTSVVIGWRRVRRKIRQVNAVFDA